MLVLVASTLAKAELSSSRGAIEPRRLHDEGLSHLRQRAVEPAKALLASLEASAPEHGFTRLLRGHCAWLVDGDIDGAEMLYDEACAFFSAGGDDDDKAEALHAVGRLCRQQQRWTEAHAHYDMAVALRPNSGALAEEARFCRGKHLLLTPDGLREAATCFAGGVESASRAWQPHFAREAANAYGLCGDAGACNAYYERLLELRALPNASVVGELLATLAAHHEREANDIPTAASFLHAARRAYMRAATGGVDETASEVAYAMAHLRAAQTTEALFAVGEAVADSPDASTMARGEESSTADDDDDDDSSLPPTLRSAAASYRAALALQPTMLAALDDYAHLLMGTSRLSNYGAAHAAALHTTKAKGLLSRAQQVETAEGVVPLGALAAVAAGTEADEEGADAVDAVDASARRRRQLEAIETTALEVARWEEVVSTLPPEAATTSGHSAGSDAGSTLQAAWSVSAAVASRAGDVRRMSVHDADTLMSLLAANEPTIITNLQSLAGFAPPEQWTPHALTAVHGRQVVKVSVSPTGRFDGAEDGRLWGLAQGSDVLVRPPETHMRLADLLTLLTHPTKASFYLEYNALHQYLGEGFASAMVPPPAVAARLRPLLTNLWLGKGATTSPLHYDEYENLLSQVAGRKRLVLFPPSDYPHLHYTPRPKGKLRYTWPDTFERAPLSAAEQQRKVLFAASINLTHPNAGETASLARCSPLVCSLEPGETLLLPAYWHHEVHSEAAATSEAAPINVAVNFWFRNETAPPACFELS